MHSCLLTSTPHARLPAPHPWIRDHSQNTYTKNVTQFSKGEYTGATQTQDDLAVMTKYITIRPDDHGNTRRNATALNGTVNTTNPARTAASVVGNIETTNDIDFMYFWAGNGSAFINILLTPGACATVEGMCLNAG